MNPSLQTSGYRGSEALVVERNRVLRNTYWLLALSMIPTVLVTAGSPPAPGTSGPRR